MTDRIKNETKFFRADVFSAVLHMVPRKDAESRNPSAANCSILPAKILLGGKNVNLRHFDALHGILQVPGNTRMTHIKIIKRWRISK